MSRLALLVSLLAACGGTSTPSNPDAGTAGFTFQPSNVALSDIVANQATAVAENVTSDCTIATDPSGPNQDCFMSPIEVVKQFDGSIVNMVVVQSLTVAAGTKVSASGTVPLVIVSLSDITWAGQLLANSTTSAGQIGPGGAVSGSTDDSVGLGLGGGPAGSASAAIGAGGGSYCGKGGPGGGATAIASSYGDLAIRPLAGGSAGGAGASNGGTGGGAVQLVAQGTLTIAAGGVITVGGAGGQFGGLSTNENSSAGGSGGAILLEAVTVSVAGTLAANGGGGGGDYSNNDGADATADANPAPGAKAGTDDGAGGAGGAGATTDGSPGTVSTGLNGGGGGGGVGRIAINSKTGSAAITGTISPSTTTLCAVQTTVRPLTEGP